MAARSLLHQLGWHSGKYKVDKEASRAPFSVKQPQANMAGNYRKGDNNGEDFHTELEKKIVTLSAEQKL